MIFQDLILIEIDILFIYFISNRIRIRIRI